jgi:hypothetical protein
VRRGNTTRQLLRMATAETLTVSAASAYITGTSGRMAEWLCSGLQIRAQRFDSASGLQLSQPAVYFYFYANHVGYIIFISHFYDQASD